MLLNFKCITSHRDIGYNVSLEKVMKFPTLAWVKVIRAEREMYTISLEKEPWNTKYNLSFEMKVEGGLLEVIGMKG